MPRPFGVRSGRYMVHTTVQLEVGIIQEIDILADKLRASRGKVVGALLLYALKHVTKIKGLTDSNEVILAVEDA